MTLRAKGASGLAEVGRLNAHTVGMTMNRKIANVTDSAFAAGVVANSGANQDAIQFVMTILAAIQGMDLAGSYKRCGRRVMTALTVGRGRCRPDVAFHQVRVIQGDSVQRMIDKVGVMTVVTVTADNRHINCLAIGPLQKTCDLTMAGVAVVMHLGVVRVDGHAS